PRRGLFSFSKAQATLEELLGVQRLEDLGKKVYVCVTDLLSGRTLYLSEGDIVPVILGSCALPGVFEPVRYGNYVFIDGGITNNLPVEPHRTGPAWVFSLERKEGGRAVRPWV
ncbi:MAG TPA: hypothetical protein EYP11_01230, partial [Aquificaceae bacterium]|nr:hypothetical protein [Aquificaceae bacterium]